MHQSAIIHVTMANFLQAQKKSLQLIVRTGSAPALPVTSRRLSTPQPPSSRRIPTGDFRAGAPLVEAAWQDYGCGLYEFVRAQDPGDEVDCLNVDKRGGMGGNQ